MAPSVSSASLAKTQPGKLRKEPSRDSQEDETNGKDKDKKKKSSVFSGLFSLEEGKDEGSGPECVHWVYGERVYRPWIERVKSV